jgi:hypothetical protein
MAVSLKAHSILRQQLLYIILGFTICLFPFFHTTYTFLEQLWNRFHFLHHILLCLPCPLLSIVEGVYWLGYSWAVGRDFFLQACRWALRPTHPPIQDKPGACFPQKSSQVIRCSHTSHLMQRLRVCGVICPLFHAFMVRHLIKNSDNHTLYLPLPFTQFIILGHTTQYSFNSVGRNILNTK